MITVKRLEIADARVMIAGARAKAEEIGVPMCIAVTDESGSLLAFERMDGGKVPSITIAIDKSYTAAGLRKGTHELQASAQPGAPAFGLGGSSGGRVMVFAGGLPVMVEGECLGGIGVSSGTSTQDREVAQAGVDAFLAAL